MVPQPSPNFTFRFTSVDANKLEDAVKVLPEPTVVALVVKVVDVELAVRYGPSVKVISDKVQLVCPVLVSLLTSWLEWQIYIVSAD